MNGTDTQTPPIHGAAHGIIFCGAPLPGLVPAGRADAPSVTVTLASHDELQAAWPAEEPETVLRRTGPDGEPYIEFLNDPERGFRITAAGHGDHIVSADGRQLLSALPDAPAWRHMKLLGAQVVPLLAALHGRELLHASAVVVDDGVVAMTAASGTGKSSVAAQLVARGASFFGDDQLALERTSDGAILAHPGLRYAKLHRHELEATDASQRSRLGAILGEDGKLHLSPEGESRALPLRALIFLERSTEPAAPDVRPEPDAARSLISAAYLGHFEEPARLLRQLDMAAAIADQVPVVRAAIRPGQQAAEVAAGVERWLGERSGP